MVNNIPGSSYPLGITPVPHPELEITPAQPVAPLPSATRSVTEQNTHRPNKTPPRSAMGLQARINRLHTTSAPSSADSPLMNLPVEMVDEIAGHLPSADLMSLSKTGQAFYDKFFITASITAKQLRQTSSKGLHLMPAPERQVAANHVLSGIKSLRKADMDDKQKLLNLFAQRIDCIPKSDERIQLAREFYLLLADMPVCETLAETTQHAYVYWRPKDEYEEAFNTLLEIQERAVHHGVMPKRTTSPITMLGSQIVLLPLNAQNAAKQRIMAMVDTMAAGGTTVRLPPHMKDYRRITKNNS